MYFLYFISLRVFGVWILETVLLYRISWYIFLIFINRYEGEKKQEIQNEKKHLSDLLKRIEERKQKKSTENSLVAKESKSKKKKSKQDKSVTSTEQDVSVDENLVHNDIEQHNETEDASQQKVHKKKKKKKNNVQVEENLMENEKNEDLKEPQKQTPEQQKDFTILGAKAKKKKYEVRRVLPDWLANPEVISIDLNSGPSVEEFNTVLDSKLIELLKNNSIGKLFPVQASMLSWLLKCNEDRQQG